MSKSNWHATAEALAAATIRITDASRAHDLAVAYLRAASPEPGDDVASSVRAAVREHAGTFVRDDDDLHIVTLQLAARAAWDMTEALARDSAVAECFNRRTIRQFVHWVTINPSSPGPLLGLEIGRIDRGDALTRALIEHPTPTGWHSGLMAASYLNGDEAYWNWVLDRLAERIEWKIHDRPTRAVLAARMETEGRELKVKTLRQGLAVALTRRNELQRIQFGQRERAVVVHMIPSELPMYYFFWWLKIEAIKAAEADLLDVTYPESSDADEMLSVGWDGDTSWLLDAGETPPRYSRTSITDEIPGNEADPLTQLEANERQDEDREELRILRDLATPAELELLDAIDEGNDQGKSVADAARSLKRAPSTARNQLANLRKRRRAAS